ncbi:MAG: hypothetical protein QOH47_824 [Sphingomonadales bacterium]|nr:hypothetical protein [Sphingomonadales bacterium]
MSHACPLAPTSRMFCMGITANWRDDRTCSYCGSLHPDDFMEQVEAGAELIPTDKRYKVYIRSAERGQQKFYFEHLDNAQRDRFLELLNAAGLKLALPGFFYVLPFFIGPAAAG